MRKLNLSVVLMLVSLMSFMNCTHDDAPELVGECEDEIGESTDELLVQRFATAPVFDGLIDDVWADTRPLVNRATVLAAGDRIIALNPESDGDTSIEPIDLMDPYTGESYEYSLRGGHDGEYLYLLFEWQDDNDSQDRQSWYFDPVTSKWRGENKYANHENDKFYEDKFGMMFPIGNPEGFAGGTCTVTCHTNLQDPQPGQKTSRHYMMNPNELADLWHWKRVRNALSQSVDDGYVQYEEDEGFASANGRKADEGLAIYSGNKFVDPVTDLAGPKYVIPGRENYYWVAQSEIDNGTAKAITGVAADGVLTYDGGTIDPTGDPDYSQGFGNKRMPSVIINPGGAGNDGRSETQVRAVHTGSGWQLEIKRKLNTGDPNDAVFTLGEEIPFALAIFNNAAIGHGQSSFLKMKFEN